MTDGIKTSEFWLTVIIIALGSFMASGLVGDGSTPMRIAGMAAATLKGAMYTMSRAKVKAADSAGLLGPADPALPVQVAQHDIVNPPKTSQAGHVSLGLLVVIVIPALVAIAACGWLGSETKATAKDLVDCTKGEAKQVTAELGPVVDVLLVNAIDPSSKVQWAPIEDIAKKFSADVGGCLLADAVTRALAPAPADPAAPKSSPLVVDQASLRDGFAAYKARTFPGKAFKTDHGAL